MKPLLLSLLWLFCAAPQMVAQKFQPMSLPAGADTIVVREYRMDGTLRRVTLWTGSNFRFSDDYYALGENTHTQYDTLEGMKADTVLIRIYDKQGRLKEESMEAKEEPVQTRLYYYSDTIFGYDEYDPNDKNGIIKSTSQRYEFYPDSTLRVTGAERMLKREGRYQTYYPNGNRQCDCYYVNGERDSLQTMYYENGQMKQQVIYRDGNPWEIVSAYNLNGDAVEKGTLKNGNGTWYLRNEQGQLEEIWEYKDGKVTGKKKPSDNEQGK